MTDNEGYANLLELYAKFIRDEDYSLSNEQKKLIKELGEKLLDGIDSYSRKNIKSANNDSKKILDYSSFESIRKNKTKKAFKKSNKKLAKDIGKEPGE